MIITRQMGAKPLASIFTMRDDPMHLSTMVLKHKEVEVIYYQNGRIKIEKFNPKTQVGPIFSMIGRLERDDAPYIFLLDRKCEIIQSKYCTAVINANCIPYEKLEEHGPEGVKLTIKDNKADLLNNLLVEFLEWNKNGGFETDFKCFVRYAEIDELVTKDLLFLAMASDSGAIVNGNETLGKPYDEGKVWYFEEKYAYDPKEVDPMKRVPDLTSSFVRVLDTDTMAEVEIDADIDNPPSNDVDSAVDEFTYHYVLNKALISKHKLTAFDEDELEGIIQKYPTLFADIVKNGWSQYDGESALDNERYDKLLAKAKMDEAKEDDDDIVATQGDEFSESYEQYYSPDGSHRRQQAFDTIKCFSCQEFVPEDQVERESVEGKLRILCLDCAENWDVGVAR